MAETLEELLLEKYSPHQSSLHNRYYVYKLIKACIYRALEKKLIKVTVYGSLPLRTFLSDGDIDITVITTPEDSSNQYFLFKIKSQLLKEFEIDNIQDIFAEVNILKFKLFDFSIDISINQIGGVRTLIFLEEVCRFFPKHLMKKAIILTKAWGTYYSRMLGSMNGLFSTYAIEILVVFIINAFPQARTSPLNALIVFIQFFSHFDWENNIVTCCGVVPIGKTEKLFENAVKNSKKLALNSEKVQYLRKELKCNETTWNNRFINISDPVLSGNNLGKNINFTNYLRIKFIFQVAEELLNNQGIEALFQSYDPQFAVHQTVKKVEKGSTEFVPISFFANIRKLKEALFCCLAVMDPSYPQNY